MFIILSVLIVIACIVMIFLVMVQNSKGGGLATNLTGGSAIASQMGSRRGADFVEKATWYVLGAMLVFAFLANVVGTGPTQETNTGPTSRFDNIETSVGNQQMPQIPGGQQQGQPQGQQQGQQPARKDAPAQGE